MKKVNPKSTLLILTALSLGILPISHVLISSPLHAAESSGRAVEPTSFAFPPGTRQPGRRANNVAKVYADDVDALNDLVYQGKRLYLTDLIRKKTLQCIQYCRVAVNEAVQGRIMEAIRNSKKALHLAVDAKQEYLLAYSKRDLASAYNIAGKDDLALRLADEALEHQSHVGMDAEALLPPLFQIRGDILLRRGDANAALEEYSRAIGYLYLKQRPFVSSSMMRAHIAAGNMVKASGIAGDLLAESAPSFRQVGLIGMGKIALRQGRPSDAIGYFNDTLKVGAGIPYLNIEAFEGLGQSNVALGDQQGAIAAYLRAARAAESLRLRFNGQEFRAGVFGQMQRIFNETVRLLMESSQTGAAWEVSERGRSRALLDMVRGGVTRSESGAVVSAASNGATTLVDLQQNLPANSVVVQYHVLGDRTYVWAITKERVSSHLISASRDVLSAKISEFRNAIVDRSAQVDILARGLYELLLKPLNLPHDRHLTIITHDSLHYLPFQALHDGTAYLVDTYTLSYAPSAGILVELLLRDEAKKGRLLALGNPTLEDASFELPGAEREVKGIAALFSDVKILLNARATKIAFVEAAARSDVLHIAAHSVTNAIDPMYSRILLSGADVLESELEAHEIYRMNLRHTRLATLSSCESALGTVTSGDEVWGFPRAFLGAGARTLLVSLWPVADDSTALLMNNFYSSFLQNGSAVSLRAAQVAVKSDPRYEHPFFWAAFNVIGDWR